MIYDEYYFTKKKNLDITVWFCPHPLPDGLFHSSRLPCRLFSLSSGGGVGGGGGLKEIGRWGAE